MVIGLTGQTGAGKSTVSDILRENKIAVIDADQVARDVVSKGTTCLADLAMEFSIEILNADGTLNRKKLAELVFGDKEKLKRLNTIIFPYIISETKRQINELESSGEEIIVLDAPTLFESHANRFCDKIISVIADRQLRVNRIMQRDSLTVTEAEQRMNSQHDDDFYTSRSDYVIENSGDTLALRLRLLEVLGELDIKRRNAAENAGES